VPMSTPSQVGRSCIVPSDRDRLAFVGTYHGTGGVVGDFKAGTAPRSVISDQARPIIRSSCCSFEGSSAKHCG